MSSRTDLATIVRAASGGFITVDAARSALGLQSDGAASRKLGALTRLGWLSRARRGLYAVVPLGASAENMAPDDSWILAHRCFSPCYIAGWSAAEHWELTEQIFRSTFIATAATIRKSDVTLLGAEFHLARVPRSRVRVLSHVWRGTPGTERVPVSSPERTIVDAARDPSWVGGARHLAEIFDAYARRPNANPELLAHSLREFGNGAAAKRIGFLTEQLGLATKAPALIEAATDLKTTGVIKFDPAVRAQGKLLRRWGLWLNSAAAS